MSDYSSFAKPVDDYSSFAKPVEDYSSFAKPVDEETSLLEDIKIPLVQATNALDTGFTLAGAGLGTIFGDKPKDELFRAMEERQASRTQWANPNERQQSFGAKLGGTVATLPVQIAAVAGQGPERMKQMIDMGESTEAAQKAGLVDTALNAASLGVPAAVGKTLLTKAATGAAANMATGAASDAYTQSVAKQAATKEAYDPTNLEARAMEGIIGAGFGSIAPTPVKGKAPKVADVKTNLDALDQQKAKEQQPVQPPMEGTQLDMPLDVPGAVDMSGFRNPYDLGGDITRQQQGMDTNLDQTQANLFQGEQTRQAQENQYGPEATINVGPDGTATYGLPTKVTDDVDVARTEQQRLLQEQATRNVEGPNLELFDESGRPLERQEDLVLAPANKAGEPKLLSDTSSPEMSRSFSKDDFRGMTFVRNGKEGVTPETILNHFRKNLRQEGDTELNRVVDAVEGFLKKFNSDGATTHGLHIELADTPTVRASERDSPAAGYYWAHDHSLVLGKEGQNVRTFVHEVLHGLTERYMEVYPNSPEVKQLKSLFDQVKGHPLAKGKYGTLNHSEMLTEAFSSRSFKRALMNIEVKVKGQVVSAWQAFTEAMFSLVGMKKDYSPSTLTAFEQLLNLTDEITTKASKDFADVARKYKLYEAKGVLPSQMQELVAQAGSNPAPSNSAGSVKISDPEVSKADQIESISGEVYIPKNPTIDEALINKIKGEKDGSSANLLTPGALAKSELGQSTLVKTVYRLMNGAYKRAEYKTNTIVKPAKDTFIKILKSPEKAKISHEILMREMKKGTDYTADELRSAGVSDDVIKAHLEFRVMMQEALEAQNAALRAKGLPEVKGIDAYISSRWSGPWRANIKDAEGNIVWQVAEHSKKKAQDAIEWIKAKQPDLKFEDPMYRKGFERGDNVEAGYLDMLKMLDKDDPRVATLESIYKDYLMGNTENVASQEKHFLRKKGVRGFAGDRPWSDNDIRDFFTQQFAYAENAFKWSEAQKSMEGVKELINNPELQESQKNNIAFSKDYVKNQLGFGTSETFDGIDNGLAKMMGSSPQQMQEYMGAAKTFFYLTKLGLSIPFTITQFVQPAITTPGWHAQLDSLGYKHNPIRSTFKSIVGGAEAALWHYGVYFNAPEFKKAAEKSMNSLDLEAAKYMEANGIIDINPMTDIKKGLRPEAVNMAAAPFEFTIKHSEVIARSMAFMGFVDHLKQSGKFDVKTEEGRLKLFEKAEDMTNLSMTDYRTQERAMAFEKMGLTGDAAATLHSYQINNLMQLVKFGKEAKNGNVKPLIYMIGMQAMAAGLTGLWFIDDLDDLIDNLKKLLPHDQYMQMKDFSIKKFIQSFGWDAVSYGLVSKASGRNIHTRMNASDQIPVWPFESEEDVLKNVLGIAPFIESTYDVGKGAFNALRPGSTPQERMAGMYAAAPTVAQGPMENLPAFSDAGVSLKPKDLSMGQIRRTEGEKGMRNYGFRSIREQKMKDAEFQLSKVERELTDRQNTAAKKAKEYVIAGEPKQAVEQMIRYDQLGGDLQSLINGIPKAKLNRVTTELERRALASQGGTKTSILKLQRYMQSVPQ